MFRNLSTELLGIRTSQREALRLATIGGFKGADINIEEAASTVDRESASYLLGMFASFGIRQGGWRLPFHINAEESVYREWTETRLENLLATASAVECPRIIATVPSWSDTLDYKESFLLYAERLKKLARMLEKYSCRLGIEFTGTLSQRQGHKYEFIHSLPETLELIHAVGAESIGLTIDTWHLFASGCSVSDLESLKNSDIVYVQISDIPENVGIDELDNSSRRLPGETGRFNTAGFLRLLEKLGYDGPVTPEPHNAKVLSLPEELSVRLTGGYLANAWKGFRE